MKTTTVIIRCLLAVAIVFMGYICVNSVTTPIHFEEVREAREADIVKNLIDIRTAENEFRIQHGRYMGDLDSLVLWIQTGTKKEVSKEGALTEKQLENGLTELKAVRMIEKAQKTGNWKEVEANGLMGFRRDTIATPLVEALYKGKYTNETVGQMIYVPHTNGVKFESEVNDEYTTSQGIPVPLVEVRTPYEAYLFDQDAQELVNLKDREEKLWHYAGLKIGSVMEPNNNAGNWE